MRSDLADRPALARIVVFFETISRQSLAEIDQLYTEAALFKDPFNEVRGQAAIRRIFEHMFDQVAEPRFVVHECIGDDTQAFLTWDFHCRRGGSSAQTLTIRGASHLRLDAGGRIEWHRDYWDAAEELYEKIPGLGALMRWLKRRASA